MDSVCSDETWWWLFETLSRIGTVAVVISGDLRLPQGHTSGKAHVTLQPGALSMCMHLNTTATTCTQLHTKRKCLRAAQKEAADMCVFPWSTYPPETEAHIAGH